MSLTSSWQTAIDAFVSDQQWNDLAASTIALRRWQLANVARSLDVEPWAVEPLHLVTWMAGQSWQGNTRRSFRTTLRGFYEWAVEQGHVEVSPALAMKRIAPTKPNPRAAPDWVYLSTIAVVTARERLMMQLAATQAMRCCEIALLHPQRDVVEDLDGPLLVVHGKGRKERVIPLEDDLARVLRSLPEGYAFPGDCEGHLSAKYVSKRCNRELPAGWTMHKLRHRGATRFYYACGKDIVMTAAFLGHADTKTTMMYVQADSRTMRAAVNAAAA